MKIQASKIERSLIKKIYNKLLKKLKETKWNIKIDPSRKGILLTIMEDKEHKLVYEIFLMNGSFLALSREPEQKLLGKIQNNFDASFLVPSLYNLIWNDFKHAKKNYFNTLQYPYQNGPLDTRIFKRGGRSDGIVLFNKQNHIKFRIFNRDNIQKIKVNVSHIIISISDKVENLPSIKEGELCRGILKLAFQDTDNPHQSNSFTPHLARKILRFVKSNLKHVQLIITQCDAGISRSSGTAAALSKIVNGNDKEFFRPPYVPNRLVYKIILNEYYNKKGSF
jgi:predicted protein tyrosine phosphatase